MKKSKLPLAPILLGGFCLLLLAVFGVIWIVQKEEENGAVTTADPSNVRELICTLPTDTAVGISATLDGQNVRLSLSDGIWVLSGDPETPVQQSLIRSLLARFQTLLAIRKIGQGELAEYGLDKPSIVVTLFCEAENYRLCYGNYNKSYDGYYFTLDGSDTVYIVKSEPPYLAELFAYDSLLALPELPDRSGMQSVTVNYPDGRSAVLPGDAADSSAQGLFACLTSLEISHRVDYGHESDSIYGLDAPVTFDITTQSGEWISLHMGRGESDEYTYLRIGQSAAVYVFTADHTELLLSYLDKKAG